MNKTSLKRILVVPFAAMVLVGLLGLAACAKSMTVTVNDGSTTTEVSTQTGKTIKDVLADGDIQLGDKDVTEPSADTALTEDMSTITVKRYAKVTIVNGDATQTAELTGGTVADALKAAGVTLQPGQVADPEQTVYLTDGMTINILMAKTVHLEVDGTAEDVATTANTVQELLAQRNITLGADDVVDPAAETELTDGMQVVVGRVEYKQETVTETIDYDTVTNYDSSMDKGTSQVTQQGVEGSKEVTYNVRYVNGQEESREAISETVISEPVSQIVVYGTKETAPADTGNASNTGRTVVSKTPVPNCDDASHGYYEILYSDGTMEYEEY